MWGADISYSFLYFFFSLLLSLSLSLFNPPLLVQHHGTAWFCLLLFLSTALLSSCRRLLSTKDVAIARSATTEHPNSERAHPDSKKRNYWSIGAITHPTHAGRDIAVAV